jgi:hypothetical protein
MMKEIAETLATDKQLKAKQKIALLDHQQRLAEELRRSEFVRAKKKEQKQTSSPIERTPESAVDTAKPRESTRDKVSISHLVSTEM